jgi:hypothetical protein
VSRFFGSLWPGGPAPADESWATAAMTEGEVALWRRMSGADRRHAAGVARRTAADLGDEATRPVLAAALLHDVGKVSSGLGPIRRALATVVSWVVGHDRAASGQGRVGRYLRHDAIGADLLDAAGSDPLTVTWAREHHLSPDRWSLPLPIGTALKAADDD